MALAQKNLMSITHRPQGNHRPQGPKKRNYKKCMNKKIIKLIKRSTFCNCSSIIVSPFPMGEWSSVEQLCSEGFDIDTVLSSVIREWGIWSGLQWFSMTTCPPPVTSHTTCTGCNSSEKMAYFINFEMASFLWRVFVCDNNIYIYI